MSSWTMLAIPSATLPPPKTLTTKPPRPPFEERFPKGFVNAVRRSSRPASEINHAAPLDLPIVSMSPTGTILLEQQGDGGEQRKQKDKKMQSCVGVAKLKEFGSNLVVVVSIEPHGWIVTRKIEDEKKIAVWPDLGDAIKTGGQSTALILLQVPWLDGRKVTHEPSFAVLRVPMWAGPISNFGPSTYVGPHARMKTWKTSPQNKVAAKTDFPENKDPAPEFSAHDNGSVASA